MISALLAFALSSAPACQTAIERDGCNQTTCCRQTRDVRLADGGAALLIYGPRVCQTTLLACVPLDELATPDGKQLRAAYLGDGGLAGGAVVLAPDGGAP